MYSNNFFPPITFNNWSFKKLLLYNIVFFPHDILKTLEATFENFDSLRDQMTAELRNASIHYKHDEHVVAVKDKFVQLNNVANWIAETTFDNPNAELYRYFVQKSSESRRGKRSKTVESEF